MDLGFETCGTLLVADHRGGRIVTDLKAAGYRVQVLANHSWTQRCWSHWARTAPCST